MSYPTNSSVFPPTSIDAFGRANINNPISNIPGAAKEFTYSQVAVLSGTIGLTTSATLIAAVPNQQIIVWGVDVYNGVAGADARSLFYSDVVSNNQIVAIINTQAAIGASSKVNFGGQPVCLPINTALQYSISTAASGQTNMMVYYSVVMSPSA
tara:strand:+ start:1696 stop:2157 length:462 start_codon:yes stop_codon:yes gene_type:complete